MKYSIIDLHCDLLGCIEDNPQELNFETPRSNCSIPQLEAGGVLLQTFAIAVISPEECVVHAQRQIDLYRRLLRNYGDRVASSRDFQKHSSKIHGILGIENALALVGEDEPLDKAFQRFEEMNAVEQILYVSLTWNQENRFGGGNVTKTGLKRDGEIFLEFLHDKKTAIDLSHTSDELASDILNLIHKKTLSVPVIASHSNYRQIVDVPRNLPEEIVKEIIALHGLMGLNFVRRFVGDQSSDFLQHIQYALSLGGENTICFGADFYGGLTIPPHLIPGLSYPVFQDLWGNSSCYPRFVDFLQGQFEESQIEKICSKNALDFLERQGFIAKET